MGKTKKRWTEEENDILRKMYADPGVSVGEIAKLLGVNVQKIYNHAKWLGLKKPKDYLRIAGKRASQTPASVANRFRKGHVPANKGKKMSPEVYARVASTMFKKGHKPVKHRPVGSERVNADGYIEIKVAEPNKWRPKHRMVWERANGPIPPGHNVQFRNGDRRDVRLENLYLISRTDQFRNENSMYARYPKEMQEVIRLRGALKRQITMHKKKTEENG